MEPINLLTSPDSNNSSNSRRQHTQHASSAAVWWCNAGYNTLPVFGVGVIHHRAAWL
jgi:hypothetical protein